MTVYVIRNGRLVVKTKSQRKHDGISFPTPMLSRLEPYESPITGKEISSWRERDAEMAANDCYDPRDLPRDHSHARGRNKAVKDRADGRERQSDDTFQWRDPT